MSLMYVQIQIGTMIILPWHIVGGFSNACFMLELLTCKCREFWIEKNKNPPFLLDKYIDIPHSIFDKIGLRTKYIILFWH